MLPSVRTVMDSETHAFPRGQDIREALTVLIAAGITGAPVVDDRGELVGMISEYECLKLLATGSPQGVPFEGKHVEDFMVPVTSIVTPDMDLYYVAGLFLAEPATRRFPVVQGGRLVAVITRKDVLRAVAALS